MHAALFALTGYRQFIVYKVVPSDSRPGKTDKFPCDYRTGKVVTAHDPEYWTDAATAEATAAAWGYPYGVGFVFTENDPFWFLDIDSCLIDGQWSPLAQQLCGLLSGAAMEVSQSGTGLHLFGVGIPPAHGCRNQVYGLEFYHSGRFVALTGNAAVGDAGKDLSAVLPALVAAYFAPDAAALADEGWTDGPAADWYGPADDADLLRRAMQSRSTGSAFGTKASFADLWLANEQVLAANYPDPGGRPYGESEADAALAQHLAFWTGRDCARIDRMMRASALVRDKWERNADVYAGPGMGYLPRTILGACGRQVEVLQDARPEPASAPIPPPPGTVSHAPAARGGDGFIDSARQIEHFAGCVYISGQNRALVPDGSLMKPDAFRVRYGGFTFNLDTQNMKTTRDAWEAWTQNQVYKCTEVDGICFRPNLPARSIVSANGQTFINTYIPVEIRRVVGDASPFLEHLAKVLPDERDRTILLSYMAACVQHQGIKFQWAPLLQGVEGNGKTLFARCIQQAVGARYTHWVNPKKLGKDFNAWMIGKVFYAVEDIYVPDSKREILEDLKPMITNTNIEIELKGIDQFTGEICGNFMFNSNHLDAIRKTENDRRFCVLFSAQQQFADLARDGMGGDYFPDLYNWLKDRDGYAIVNELLFTYAIPAELNPAVDCQRAPITTSTSQAISAGLGSLEQEIAEAVAQGLPGFSGDWISTTWLERLLEKMNLRKISHTKRKQILEQMGYIYHPALVDGRTNNPVLPDNTKPRLFVLAGSLTAQIPTAAAATKAYEAANANKSPLGLPFAAHQFGRG
jgi:hypothetical protein